MAAMPPLKAKSGFPVSNKLLQKRWNDKAFQLHQQKVAAMKADLDNKSPKPYQHIRLRLKKLLAEEERQAQVDHDNRKLLARMTQIMRTHGSLDNWNDYTPRSLNYYVREKEAERIATNNELIKSRLLGVQPSYNLNKWEEDFLKHEYYLANMAAVTKDYDLDSLEPTPRDPPRRRRPRSAGTETRSVETEVLECPPVSDAEDGMVPVLTHDYYLVDNTEEPRDFYVDIIMQTKPLKKRTSILKNWAEHANVWSGPKTDRSTEAASTTDGEVETTKLPKIKLERSKGGGTWPPRRFHTKLPKVNRVDKNKVDLSQHDVDRDSRMLFKATKGLSQNEVSIVIKTLVRRTYRQRQETKAKFWELYDKELSEDLKSQLSDDFAPVIDALLVEREKFDAMTVHDALKGSPSAEATLIEILCTRNNRALEQIKKAYRDEHLNNLEDDVRSETAGQLQDLLLGLLAGDRDESNQVDEDLARQDAQELYENEKDRWSTDSDSKLMSLITTKSYAHIRATFTEYEKLAQTDMLDVLKDELSGEFFVAMVALVKVIFYCPKFFAERIYRAMRPRGDAATLIRCLMTRAEADMPLIRKVYKKTYGATIMDDLESYVSAPYKPILVDLVRGSDGQDGQKKSQKRINGMVIHRAPPQLRPLRHQPIPPPKPVDVRNNPLAQPSQRPLAAAQREKSFEKTNERLEGGRNGSDKENRDRGKGKAQASGSVVPAKRFHVERDCEDFRNAISRWGTDEEPLIKLLSSRSHDQRQQVKKQYKTKYNKDLLQDLKAEMGSSYDDILVMLLTPRPDFDAWTMHKATQANDDNSQAVFAGILCTRSNKQIRAMRETYKKLFSRNLLDDLKACSTDRLADLLLALTKGDREERGKVDQSRAKEDAHELYEEDKLGASERSRIVEVLANRSVPQLKATLQAYKKVSGRELLETIESEMPDTQKVGFAAIVRCLKDPAKFFAGRLAEAVSGSEGMDEDTLMRIVVTRSEVDLLEIKRLFKDQQGQALAETVEDSCKGDHKKLLLALIKGNKGS
ncbi:annexin A6-like [Branchiostoma floridae]|uniref:Annexin n=1 Tax=Branchiostoma floridae TaxID=7739 RepID=A0A9J7MUK2_BRAFL|nr:annexin A6-like [Branchiostoma floridae]